VWMVTAGNVVVSDNCDQGINTGNDMDGKGILSCDVDNRFMTC